MKIERISQGLQVADIYWKLQQNPHLWGEHTNRTTDIDSPHHGLNDIWARYGDPERTQDDRPHDAHWYPAADVLGVKPLCFDLMRYVNGVELGGVLITRIPPGATCKPHKDLGWHALRYEKFAVQITSAPGQLFQFEGESLETKPGDVFTFNNQNLHWVTNDTKYERITLIACIRKEK
jgi:quercetin dioxygenase-like cupin family protein